MQQQEARALAEAAGALTGECFDLNDAWAFPLQPPPGEPPQSCAVIYKESGEAVELTEYLLRRSTDESPF